MNTRETIPPEIRASVEANTLFDAVRRGDYSATARAQERLRDLGWYIDREPRKRNQREVASCR